MLILCLSSFKGRENCKVTQAYVSNQSEVSVSLQRCWDVWPSLSLRRSKGLNISEHDSTIHKHYRLNMDGGC